MSDEDEIVKISKEIWDFSKSVCSEVSASGVIRFLVPSFTNRLSSTATWFKPKVPSAIRFSGRQLASVRDALIDVLRIYRRNRVAQVGATILLAGFVLGETAAAQWAPVVVGPPLMLYLGWGFLDGLQRRVRPTFNVRG